MPESLGVYLYVLAQVFEVGIYQLLAQLVGVTGRGLPEETGYVILYRSPASALEVYEEGVALCIQHHVAGLEVAVHECFARYADYVARHQLERGFKLQFVEIKSRSLQEAILEIIEVEEYVGLV